MLGPCCCSVDSVSLEHGHGFATRRDAQVPSRLSIGDALNLAILEEMLRDPKTTIHAEDLQAGSSYNIPKLTQQTFGTLRAADEIIVLPVPRAQRRKDYVACCCCGTA